MWGPQLLWCQCDIMFIYLFTYLGFYVAFNTVQVIPRRVLGRAEETSTYSSLGFCTVNCRPNGKQLPAFPLEAMTGIKPRPQRCGYYVQTMPVLPLQSNSLQQENQGIFIQFHQLSCLTSFLLSTRNNLRLQKFSFRTANTP